MARVNKEKPSVKKEAKKATKGELALQIGVGAVLLAVVAFIVVLIVLLVTKTDDEEENVYENFVSITVAELEEIIDISIDQNSGDYSNLSAPLRELLLDDTDKNIYILFYSPNDTDYSDEETRGKLEELLIGVPGDTSGKSVFLVVDGSVQTGYFDSIKAKLGENGQDIGNLPSSMNIPSMMLIKSREENVNNKYSFYTRYATIESQINKNVK